MHKCAAYARHMCEDTLEYECNTTVSKNIVHVIWSVNITRVLETKKPTT